MAEVNEISNQANLDYIFDSYYSSVSRYNTGFELPEDCKNMSFSELFDQELFSTHENKDCQITIKIEKEEQLNECYSADNSVDTADSLSFVKIEENIPSSSLSKSFAPKRGINRTSIKTMGTSDVKHLIHNPFCETEQVNNQMLGYINSSIVKCEAEDVKDNVEENLVEMEVNPYYSADGLRNNTGLEKSEEHIVSSSLFKSSTPKRRGINRISIKTPDNSDAKHLFNPFCEPKDLANYQIPAKVQTPIIKCEPIDENETIEETIVGLHYSPNDSQTTSNSHNMVKVKNSVSKYGLQSTNSSHNVVKVIDSVTPLLLKKSTSKCQGINKISLKTTNNVNHPSKSKHLGTNQISVKVQTPIVKIEPENVDKSIEKPIVKKEVKPCYSADNLNCTSNNRNFLREEIRLSSLLKNSASKRRANNKKSIKATKNDSVKHIAHNFHFEPKQISNNQNSVELATTVIKREPEDFYDTSKENIEMMTNPSYSSSNGIKSKAVSHSLVKIDKIVSSPKGLASQHRSTNGNSIKTTDNSKNHLICNLNYKPKDLGNSLTSVKYKIPIIKREPENDNNTIQPNALNNLKSEKEIKFVDSNEIHSSDLINKNAESQEIIIKNMVTIASSIKTEDIDYQTDKKKISWEEFRAKREKMGLINISEIKEEPAIDIVATDNVKMKAMKEEFDRNTAEHFTGQKRKIDDKEEQNTTAKEINNEEEELQKKRMKIEYIKKLLPSSFASEIAKTSSLMKGSLVEDNDNESTSDDSMLSNDKTQGKYLNTHDKSQKKGHQTRVHSSHRNSSRSDYNNKSSRSSSTSSNPDDYYNRNRTDAPSQGSQYNQNARNTLQRPKEQKRVVYVGQIPIKLGKRYLYNRFKEFGTIQSLTLHKKPDFRVYYAFVTYSENSEADRAIAHGNDDDTEVQLDIRFGERKQTQTPYYDLDDEWLTDWYGYKQPLAPVVKAQTPEKVSFEEELQEFYKLAQIKKLNKIKSSQVS
ncbi:uncharacterized protein LOC132948541 isoform X2 [Metopolophium dirhodum]|nr:uncharacterized protein LOC132948541 isoform X2 [Metopolophium dirhodum]XP_060875037.1 uncharacterized protein LOC132948541 isoform X2 [Metopolophium dirhodum]